MFVVGGALFETGGDDKIGGIVTRYASLREAAHRYYYVGLRILGFCLIRNSCGTDSGGH